MSATPSLMHRNLSVQGIGEYQTAPNDQFQAARGIDAAVRSSSEKVLKIEFHETATAEPQVRV